MATRDRLAALVERLGEAVRQRERARTLLARRSAGGIADSHDEVTVLFASLVGSKPVAEGHAPGRMADVASDVFSTFDDLVERHGLEKVEAPEDAYAAAAGVAASRSDHAEAAADLALALREALPAIASARDLGVALRVGMDTGPVAAAVTGVAESGYDLWGDTVATAKRLESRAPAGGIQVSERLQSRLAARFAFDRGEEVAVGSDETMTTYLLLARRTAPGAASAVADAPPEAYDRHVGRYGSELAAEMIRLADFRPGQRALDVGCGTGALTVALAAVAGAENVAAIDASERFVAVCRSRAPGVDVRVASAESMPFPDASFDAVLAQLVVDGLGRPREALAEMRRVAVPGGAVAACVWNLDGGMTLLRTVWDAARALDADRARSFGADRELPFSRPGQLEELWRTTGLEDVEVGKLDVGADYDDVDDLWSPFAAGVGRLGDFVRSLDDDAAGRMKLAVAERLGNPQARFRLTAEAWYVRGRAVR